MALESFDKHDLCPHCLANPCQCITNDAGELNMTVNDTLAQRGTRYGAFPDHADISQNLQSAAYVSGLPEPYMREAAMMICHKLARIANGDPYYDDSWRDIAGYAQLVVDTLNEKE